MEHFDGEVLTEEGRVDVLLDETLSLLLLRSWKWGGLERLIALTSGRPAVKAALALPEEGEKTAPWLTKAPTSSAPRLRRLYLLACSDP